MATIVTRRNLVFMFPATREYLASQSPWTVGVLRPKPHHAFAIPRTSLECFITRDEAFSAAYNAELLGGVEDLGRFAESANYSARYESSPGHTYPADLVSRREVWRATAELLLERAVELEDVGYRLLAREAREAQPSRRDPVIGHDGRPVGQRTLAAVA